MDKTATANMDGYDIELTAQDLASPGAVNVSLYALKTGVTLASRLAYVGYNVAPNDAVFDGVRNRFYLTTSTVSSDPLFPANSLIAFDPLTNRVVFVLAIGASPTSLALSDDGASL